VTRTIRPTTRIISFTAAVVMSVMLWFTVYAIIRALLPALWP
jgi:hypothetical protein